MYGLGRFCVETECLYKVGQAPPHWEMSHQSVRYSRTALYPLNVLKYQGDTRRSILRILAG